VAEIGESLRCTERRVYRVPEPVGSRLERMRDADD
jgi:hypothetical protein